MWLIETDVMAKRGQPVLTLVSRVFLKDHERIIEDLTRTGHGVLLCYTLQQIEQFRSQGEEFVMQHADTEYMDELEEELQTAVLEAIPVERRLRGLAPEERLRGLPAEERLRGLSSEEVVCENRNRAAANFALVKDRLVAFIQDTPPYEGGVPFFRCWHRSGAVSFAVLVGGKLRDLRAAVGRNQLRLAFFTDDRHRE